MELYEYARPELMAGKKILFVHGFASSGQNGSVKTLRLLLPECEIIAPDIPVNPVEGIEFLKQTCSEVSPDLVIGTSMGGMLAEQLYDYDRIVVNPAFHLADTLLKNNGLGKQEFHNPRQDGQTSFMVTKALLEDFRKVSSLCFSNTESGKIIYGLFGIHDKMVDCFDEFAGHYRNAIRFDGEHYLNDHAILRALLPVIQWIDDIRNGKERRSVVISLEDTLMNTNNSEQMNGASKVFARLSQLYDTYIVTSYSPAKAEDFAHKLKWIEENIGVPAWDRVISCNNRKLLLSDYLIDYNENTNHNSDFMGTFIKFGSEEFRNWEEILVFFERLGGQ